MKKEIKDFEEFKIDNNARFILGGYTINTPANPAYTKGDNIDMTVGEHWDTIDGTSGGTCESRYQIDISIEELANMPIEQQYDIINRCLI